MIDDIAAQEIIAQDWYACYQAIVKGKDCQ